RQVFICDRFVVNFVGAGFSFPLASSFWSVIVETQQQPFMQCRLHFQRWREFAVLSGEMNKSIFELKREGKKLLKKRFRFLGVLPSKRHRAFVNRPLSRWP